MHFAGAARLAWPAGPAGLAGLEVTEGGGVECCRVGRVGWASQFPAALCYDLACLSMSGLACPALPCLALLA